MSVPKYQELYAPIIKTLEDGQAHHFNEIKDKVVKQLCLTEGDLQEMLPSGLQTKFENRISWARTYLKRAGLIESTSRGVYILTEEGQRIPPDLDAINDKYLKKYKSFREFRNLENGFDLLSY